MSAPTTLAAVHVPLANWIELVYLLAAVGFILALKGLSSPKQARNGNLLGAVAAAVAVGITFAYPAAYKEVLHYHGINLLLTVAAMVLGAAIAVPVARKVKMTAMPQLVAIFNGVGGGTVIYTAHWPRLHPSDFRVKSLDGVADDWPIDYWTLEKFYEENDRMMGVSGLPGDPGVPPRHPPMPPVPMGRTGTLYAQAMNKLGWHWWPSDTTIATTEYDGRAKCINIGHCTPGCAQGAKASTDITYWPLALRSGNVELRPRSRVRKITTDRNGMASGAIYYDRDGKEHFQPAEIVILACNGVGTPRLLLNSASARFPDGLANSSGMVGKNLMFHPYAQTFGYVDEEMDGNHGPPLCLWSAEFYETDPDRDFVRG